jgi:far upstream element-binding protein
LLAYLLCCVVFIDNPQVRTLNIGAESKEAVDAAQMEIFMALQMQQQQSQQAYNSVSNNFTFPIPDDKVGIVIGKSGVTVKDLQNRLRVKIQIPQMPDPGSNPPVRTLSVAGSPDMQMMAKYEIEMMLVGTPIPGTVAAAGSAGITAVSNGYGMYGSQMGQYGGGGGGMYPQQQLQQYGYYGMPPQAPANMYGMQYPTQQAALYGMHKQMDS